MSKDNDFRQRVFLEGPPPKVIWLAIGNAGTAAIAAMLRSRVAHIEGFGRSAQEGLLVIERG